jgi:hypothetical protein
MVLEFIGLNINWIYYISVPEKLLDKIVLFLLYIYNITPQVLFTDADPAMIAVIYKTLPMILYLKNLKGKLLDKIYKINNGS